MNRLQIKQITKDLNHKMVFLSGPRQVGKTTLAKSLAEVWGKIQYLNFDNNQDRPIIMKQIWDRTCDLVILDEYHKLKTWKRQIKGIYDVEGIAPRLLVTGSARLDIYRRGSDSLAGRYFLHRLHPLSVKEIISAEKISATEALDSLLKLGGFPEPYLSKSEMAAARWRKQHLERIVREDVQDLNPTMDIQTLLLFIDLLKERVSSSTSLASLARDLEISPHTAKRWLMILEQMFVVIRISPYHKNLARAILKEPKIYFYDTGAITESSGARLENTIALHLIKWLHHLEDTEGKTTALHYIKDKEKHEVDFMVIRSGEPPLLIEVKESEANLSPSLLYYAKRFPKAEAIQLVKNLDKTRTVAGCQIMPAADWLAKLPI